MVNDNSLAYPNIHVWDATSQQYVSFLSGASSAVIPYNNSSAAATSNSSYNAIEPFQAFWVKTSDATETQYELKNTYRSTDYAGLTPAPILKTTEVLQINVFNALDSTWDGVVVGFDPSASLAFETDKDSYKLFSPANVPSLYLKASDKFASINAVPLNTSSVPLYFRPSKNVSSNRYFINLDETRSSSRTYVFLEDLKTNTVQKLNGSSYSFEHSEVQGEARFILHFSMKEEFHHSANLENIRVVQNKEELILKDFHSNELADIYLFDLSGRILLRLKAQLNQNIILPKNAIKGVVVLKVTTFNQMITKKVFLN